MKKYLTILLATATSFTFADDENYDGQTIAQDFSDESMNYSSWNGATIHQSTFKNVKLNYSNFNKSKLAWGADATSFSHSSLDNSTFTNANLVYASYEAYTPEGYSKVDFTDTSIKNCDFSSSILSKSYVATDKDKYLTASVDFSAKDLGNVNFSNATLASDLSSVLFTDTIFVKANFSNAILSASSSRYKATSVNLSNLKIENSDFSFAIMASACDRNASAVTFKNSILTGSDFSNAQCASVAYGGANAVDFSDTVLNDAIFRNSKLFAHRDMSSNGHKNLFSGANFVNAQLRNTDFSSSILGDNTGVASVNFSNANLINAKFNNATFGSGVYLYYADLRGADLTGAVDVNTAKTQNTIWNDGVIKNVSLLSSDEILTIRKYIPIEVSGEDIVAKISESDATISGGSELILEEGAKFEISNGKKLSVEDGSLTIKTNNDTSTIFTVESGSSLSVSENTSINIYVTVEGSQNFILPIISWNENAAITGFDKLTKGTNIKLYVNNVLYEGDWETKIENNSLIVFTIAPANIVEQPSRLELFSSKIGILSVSATGQELTYQWYFNDEAIKGATEATLIFDSIQVSATGSYYCIITNPAGSVQSSSATVTVHQSATEDSLTKGLEKVTTVSGTGHARFVVETTAYNPTYKWYYGSDSAGWTEFENETSNILFIPAESKYNRKNIKCEISNGGGSVSTQAVLVYSSTAIQITSQPQDVSFKLNENASFNVTVSTSTGNAYYQWQYSTDGNEWQDIENATEATYSFKMMDSKNRGYYRCEIDNGGGVLYSENAKIIFPENVAITEQPTAITSAIIGTKATFTVVVSGYEPKYQWQVSYDYGDTWQNIANATSVTLSVDVVENITGNSYRCLVWNDNNVDAPLESEMVWIENVIEPTAFQEWSMANGLGIDASPSATPHNDGITNLEKFAFGLDASKATSYDANANFKHSTDASGNTTLQFPVSVDAEGVVNVKALKSVDLIDWEETTATATGETSSDGKFKIYKVTAPVGEEGKVFLKLQVEEK